MPLLKKREMTEKQLAAIRRNQKLSQGATTEKGRKRIRAALLRHGFYSKAEEVAMRALGEDPAQFQVEIAPVHPDSRLMRRMQDSNFREVRRLTSLLTKLKRQQHRPEVFKDRQVCAGTTEI